MNRAVKALPIVANGAKLLRNNHYVKQMRRPASSLVTKIDAAIDGLPHREAARYTEKNMKWTALEFRKQAESHANALLEVDLVVPGDTIGIWMKDSAEKDVTMLAAAKIGLKVVDIDTSIENFEDMRVCLAKADCKVLYFDPISDTANKLEVLRKAIPEFFYYDDSKGQFFHSKHFKKLKFFVHTGFDIEMGSLNFKRLFLPHPAENFCLKTAAQTKDDQPFYTLISKNSASGQVEMGPTLPYGKVLEQKAFDFANKLINKEYFEK